MQTLAQRNSIAKDRVRALTMTARQTMVEIWRPVQDVADSCTAGAATNVIFGLA
uniref:Uncharacterized protein n=1 Tax=Helianthus annuus TaxID=4232 RepID=A0A251UIS7_HELAN